MSKKLFFAAAALACVLGLGCFSFPSMAMDTEEQEEDGGQDGYITIAVDAEDDSGELMYAIDSDAPEAFGESNIFVIDPAIPHTIYVRDTAGNITSQSFQPIGVEYEGADTLPDDYAPSADTNSSEAADAAEDGGGTVYDKAVTDGTDRFRRVFYTLTTKEGEVFYLVIDQNRGQDNVYLLNMVTVDDLQALAGENGYILSERQSSSQTDSSKEETIEDLTGDTHETKKKGSKTTNFTSSIIILVAAVIGGGIYYYLKIYKKKKDAAMDEIDQALDMDAFVSDESDREDEEDEIDMPADQTIPDDEFSDMYNEEESAYLNMDPDEEEGE